MIKLAPLAAGSIQEVLEYLQRSPSPRALLCDYHLREGQTGIEAFRMVQRVLGKKLPTVIVTGDTLPSVITEARDLGLPILFKPVDPARLRETLTKLLRTPAP